MNREEWERYVANMQIRWFAAFFERQTRRCFAQRPIPW